MALYESEKRTIKDKDRHSGKIISLLLKQKYFIWWRLKIAGRQLDTPHRCAQHAFARWREVYAGVLVFGHQFPALRQLVLPIYSGLGLLDPPEPYQLHP
ncbi:MAG: hypothetical protein KME13_17620 [Myxacorys californica WJT36-NPBG1]|nr:hypothetical protein [Myxacorys californica WJT36-NPBG1]